MAKKSAALRHAALHPYRSFLFLQVRSGKPSKAFIGSILTTVGEMLEQRVPVAGLTLGAAKAEGALRSRFGTYTCERPPSWTDDPRFVDVANHLIVASAYKSLLAMFVSEDRLREQINAALAEGAPSPFDTLDRIVESRLNAAFVIGEARTLWLSATHLQTSRKPDRKVLSGPDLRDALNPLDDQSFFFTAARCRPPGASKATYGVSPRKSTLWVGPSKSWAEYVASVGFYLKTIDDCTNRDRSPLPILASTVDVTFDQATLGLAFEVSLTSAELPAEPQTDGALATEAGEDDLFLELADAVPPHLRVEAFDAATASKGRCDLTMTKAAGAVLWEVAPTTNSAADIAVAAAASRRTAALRVWFDQGFMVSGDTMFETHLRDLPFAGFRWADFGGYDITTEKPTPLSAASIGAQQSLFCWIRSRWAAGQLDWLPPTGWLACNDGAMEIADFIHFSGGATPLLTLVHVKAAKGVAPDRPVRVTPYEVVVSQALKNLRHLDGRITSDEFFSGLSAALQSAVWSVGGPADRNGMRQAIHDQGARADRRVVVVQPHTLRSQRDAAMAATATSDRRRIAQLHTLLCAAQGECAALGAEFMVIGAAG
jgi:hypothetical protein